jgi:hypothetical protein
MRDAVESSLRRRHCDAVVLSGTPNARVDGAACYRDGVLLFRLRDGAPGETDVHAMRQAALEFERVAPSTPVRGVIVATDAASSAVAGSETSCSFLNASQLEDSMDRLFEELKRDAFVRLTGTSLMFMRPDPRALLARPA